MNPSNARRQSEIQARLVLQAIAASATPASTGAVFAAYQALPAPTPYPRFTTMRNLSHHLHALNERGLVEIDVISRGRFGRTSVVRLTLLGEQALAKLDGPLPNATAPVPIPA